MLLLLDSLPAAYRPFPRAPQESSRPTCFGESFAGQILLDENLYRDARVVRARPTGRSPSILCQRMRMSSTVIVSACPT